MCSKHTFVLYLAPLFLFWNDFSGVYGESIRNHYNWNLLEHEICGESMSDRIIGGSYASLGQYPWLARIGYTIQGQSPVPSFRCAGTLINKLYVITAAHCVHKIPPRFRVASVRLGESFADTNVDCEGDVCAPPAQDFAPTDIIVHSYYNSPRFRNDIALIRLNRTANYNGYVAPICLPWGSQMYNNYVGTTAEVAGWGIFDVGIQKPSNRLMVVTLPIVSLEMCLNAFRKYTTLANQQLCVGGKMGQDSCSGDSGGPLMQPSADHGSPRYYILGIVSFGTKRCGGSSLPAVYTYVGAYVKWILDNILP